MNENTAVKTKKTRGFKPNVIDLLVIVIIIAAIIGIVLRSGVVEQVTMNNSLEKARVSFRIADISETSASYLGAGDAFYSTTHKCSLGTLESVAINPAEYYIADEHGTLIKTESINHRVDVRGTVICEGVFTEDGFFLGGANYIAPNSGITVKSPSIVVSLTVTDIEKIAEPEQ